jgi:4-hydroxy-tetrahydrodipicolinate reductase
MLRLAIAGATGRMGKAVIKEAVERGHQIIGALEASDNPAIGRTLKELNICDSDIVIANSDLIRHSLQNADVYISFTTPEAEEANIPMVANLQKRIVLGTTGFNQEQNQLIISAMSGKVPAVFSPNYSVGVNILFKITELLRAFPPSYDFSISEIHHTGKKDAPSGTAKKLGEIVANIRNYSSTITGRAGISQRNRDELEIIALRAGGVPGIHDLIIAGQYEMLRIEHTAFSRNVFAQGAVYAAEWLSEQEETKVFSMADVLGL